MAYLSELGYKFDVFVSYGRIDDDLDRINETDGEQGWVEALISRVEQHVQRRAGRSEPPALFFDKRNIVRTRDFREQLREYAASSAIILIITSPRYLNSDWCKVELEHYLAGAKKRNSDPCISLACMYRIESEKTPESLSGFTPINFYKEAYHGRDYQTFGYPPPVKTSDTYATFDRCTEDLAGDIFKAIQSFQPQEAKQPCQDTDNSVVNRDDKRPAILLGTTVQRLDAHWQRLRNALIDSNFDVIHTIWPMSGAERAALKEKTKRARAGVFLLAAPDENTFDKDLFARLQEDIALARECNLEFHLWLEDKLEQLGEGILSQINATDKKYTSGKLPEMIRALQKLYAAPDVRARKVLLGHGPDDEQTATTVQAFLEQDEADYNTFTCDEKGMTDLLPGILQDVTSAILIARDSPPTWIRIFISEAKKCKPPLRVLVLAHLKPAPRVPAYGVGWARLSRYDFGDTLTAEDWRIVQEELF